jgi:hypothetical protein
MNWLEILYFRDLKAQAKFQETMTTPSGVLVTASRRKKEERIIPKIVAQEREESFCCAEAFFSIS